MEFGTIIIIDDDRDDLEMMSKIIQSMKLPNHVLVFQQADAGLNFLKTTTLDPLFILCDINMPILNGFELRKQLLSTTLNIKKTPFIFLSTSLPDPFDVTDSHADGFFEKASTFSGMKKTIENVVSLFDNTPLPAKILNRKGMIFHHVQ